MLHRRVPVFPIAGVTEGKCDAFGRKERALVFPPWLWRSLGSCLAWRERNICLNPHNVTSPVPLFCGLPTLPVDWENEVRVWGCLSPSCAAENNLHLREQTWLPLNPISQLQNYYSEQRRKEDDLIRPDRRRFGCVANISDGSWGRGLCHMFSPLSPPSPHPDRKSVV